MKLKDTTGESQVICTWDNFDQFIKNEKPEQIEVCDEMKCIRSNFTIKNHNSYNLILMCIWHPVMFRNLNLT